MKTFYDSLSGRTLVERNSAFLFDSVFSEQDFSSLVNNLNEYKDATIMPYDASMGRFQVNTTQPVAPEFLIECHQGLTSLARSLFSPTLMPSYALWATYQGYRANLPKHIDDNACTYTIDLCVSHKTPWSIYVEDEEFTLQPNQAIVYYGEDQYHWRNKFPDPYNNQVEMIFFHFVEPDHWWFTKGPQHMNEMLHQQKVHRQRNK